MGFLEKLDFPQGLVLLWLQLVTFQVPGGVDANFNFYLGRREFQKLHGISTDIYYVREGVVNEYATSFLVTVPSEVDDLNFCWQALSKKPVFYNITIDYTDFFALLPPLFNISNTGRVPERLEAFRLSLLCSGRSNAEVSITIRIVFQIKHPKLTTTGITIKRNKICLFQQDSPISPPQEGDVERMVLQASGVSRNTTSKLSDSTTNKNSPLQSDDSFSFLQKPTPTLLIVGLLGGCVVTASTIFLTLFICFHRKLTSLTPKNPVTFPPYSSCHDNETTNSSSLSCLPRPNQCKESSSWKNLNIFPGVDQKGINPIPNSDSQNSYITIPNSWNDVISTSSEVGIRRSLNASSNLQAVNQSSDVSPYACAHIVQYPLQPPTILGAPPSQWYSQTPCRQPFVTSNAKTERTHLYANNLSSTFSPKKYTTASNHVEVRSDGTGLSQGHRHVLPVQSPIGSIIEIEGFQCRRDLQQEGNVIERFL